MPDIEPTIHTCTACQAGSVRNTADAKAEAFVAEHYASMPMFWYAGEIERISSHLITEEANARPVRERAYFAALIRVYAQKVIDWTADI